MKKLIIGEVNLLEPQNLSVLVALSHKMVKNHSLMSKLASNLIEIPMSNDVFFDNVRVMLDRNSDFSAKYDEAVVNSTIGFGDPFDYDVNEFEFE